MSRIVSATIQNQTVKVHFKGGQVTEFECIWLRDHCRCSTCYHSNTFQRARHLLDLSDSNIKNIKSDTEHISITWDDNHESIYKADFLVKFDYKTWVEKRRHIPKLWHGEEIAEKVVKVSANDFFKSPKSAREVFQSLLDYGVALIVNVEPTMEATEKVCKALGGVQHTMFGGMWLVHTDTKPTDTAYTNIHLAQHTDNTYFTEAAGLQIFHGLEHTDGTGGETILVDGFYGAKRLEKEFPDDYKFLTSFDIDAEFLDNEHHHRYSAPVITINKMKDIKQIRIKRSEYLKNIQAPRTLKNWLCCRAVPHRAGLDNREQQMQLGQTMKKNTFNSYDRTPMAFSSREECLAYYRALKNLARYYEEPSNQWQFKLTPGVVIAIDNFRVLHGRTSFTGNRILCGSYVSRSDWLNKARTLRLIE
ncbi:unnamed protein product [Parnassius apollo]|uniref:trimethyllysine dioxygenase n=1 Tax=Parnassius apollo TaxID=110799 RepID=A0A8S3XBL1_PARAO|nr:unnamed protein product [Parnassius apollo]